MQHPLQITSSNTWHAHGAPGFSAAVRHRPAAALCHPRLSRCVRSSITRAVDPQHHDQQPAPPAVPAVEPQPAPPAVPAVEPQQQQQQPPASGAALQQVAVAAPQQQPQPSHQALPQQQTQQSQQQKALTPQHQHSEQARQQLQEQQPRSATPAQPQTPHLLKQQQQQRTSSSSKQEPGRLQRFLSLMQHIPAALIAFLVGGLGACMLLFGWAKGSPMRKNQPYTFSITFQEASKLDEGTPVRMKGVQIGTVTKVLLSPSHITAYAEVPDQSNIIPCASRVDINLLGLASDPWIDITPPVGCAVKRQHGPHHTECQKDGLIVCNGGHIKGSQGGSTDFMMKFFLSQHDRTRQKTVDVIYHSRNA